MRLLLIRHAIAEDRARFAKSGHADDLRPLTVEGRKKMRKIAEGIARLVPKLDLVATSTLVRAVETGQMVARAYESTGEKSKVKVVEAAELAPGGATGKLLAWVTRQKAVQTVALVGHEPELSTLAGVMLTGDERSLLVLRKGGACLIETDAGATGKGGKLCWLLTPRQLRNMA